MKIIKYFLFSLICLFSCSVVFAKDEIFVDSIIPVYDDNSGVIVTEKNGEHSVIFNDKDQSVKYNVVLKNNTNKDIPIENLSLPKPTEDFLKYELTGLNGGDVIKANSTKDVVISLETVKTEGWGRNFDIVLTSEVNLDSSVLNPNTNDFVVILFILSIVFGCSVFVLKNKKVARYGILIIGFFSIVPYINADKQYIVPIKINVSFESQNIMKPSGCEYDASYGETWLCVDYWLYFQLIKNFYIENDLSDISDYVEKFDVSQEQNSKVVAYLVKNDESYYDVYLQADGIIYFNEDSSFYFADARNLERIVNLQGVDTSKVTDMSYMFFNNGMNVDNLEIDFKFMNTSNVINMSYMFKGTGYNALGFTLDVSNFDTSKVTDMRGMFYQTGFNNPNFTLDVSNFDTSNVTDMSYMFNYTGANNPNFALDVSDFDTSNVTDMSGMFSGTGTYSQKFNTSITIRNPNMTSYNSMFSEVATKSGSRITVNYTKDTEALVDKMIATKSTNSNVVKGIQVD